MTTEIWALVPGSQRYEVSNEGRVRNAETGKLRNLYTLPSGHKQIRFEGRTRYVHRLVLEAFVGPCPEEMQCCHGDGVPSNNHVGNLRWDTISGNRKDAVRHGTMFNPFKDRTACSKGHEYVEGSFRIEVRESGVRARICRTCSSERQKAYMKRKKVT